MFCHWTNLLSVIIYILSIQTSMKKGISLLLTLTFIFILTTEEKQKTSTTNMITALFHVNHSLISSKQQQHLDVWSLHSDLIRYGGVCFQYIEFWIKISCLLTQTLLKISCITPRLKSWQHKFYGRHHDLVEYYEIPISQ